MQLAQFERVKFIESVIKEDIKIFDAILKYMIRLASFNFIQVIYIILLS